MSADASTPVRCSEWMGSCVSCNRDTSGEMTWPGEKDGEICQECWEAECSRSWWEMVIALDAAGLMQEPIDPSSASLRGDDAR